jgi:putative mRNA 3-end processing factor
LIVSTKATVTDRGAIILGKNTACDAFDESKPLRVVTHAHADHLTGLRQSLKTSEKILMTKATKDLIDVLRTPKCLTGGFVETLDYGRTIQYDGERLTFFKADHILGAAQVLVEDSQGTRIVNTGDFRIDETPVLDADILVMEATYGSPWCKRAFNMDVKSLLVSLVEKGLKQGTVYVFGYHGKLQEVMQILHQAGVEVPFVAPEKVHQVARVCENHGMQLGYLISSEEKEAKEMLETNSSCVVFYHMNCKSKMSLGRFCISVSGWEFGLPCRETGDREYTLALSDHSDFNGLIEYVKLSKPKLVITDSFRVGHAENLAKEIRKRFGILAMALPKR